MRTSRMALTFLASLVSIAAVVLAFFIFTSAGAAHVLHAAAARLLGPGHMTYARIEGSLIRGVRVFNMELQRPHVLRAGSVVRVQELDMRLARFSLDGLQVSVVNARIIDPRADPVVITGAFSDGHYGLNVYSGSLDLRALRQVIKQFRNPPLLAGELKAFDLVLSGTLERPVLEGKLEVDHIPQNGFVLQDAPVQCHLYFMRSSGLWGTHGSLVIERGWLRAPRCLVRLGESRLTFDGDPLDPQLDLHATSTVGRTRIDISVKGSRREPQVTLVSDPPLPEEQLMIMLTTGKRWDGVGNSMMTRKMTPQLAGDFVDYFFFGGAGLHVAKWFGLSGISYRLDAASQGVTFNKDISDRLGVGYDVEVSADAATRQKEITQKVESEYQVTDNVTVGAQKEILPVQRSSTLQQPRRVPDDRVYLKYRTRF